MWSAPNDTSTHQMLEYFNRFNDAMSTYNNLAGGGANTGGASSPFADPTSMLGNGTWGVDPTSELFPAAGGMVMPVDPLGMTASTCDPTGMLAQNGCNVM